MPENSGQQGVTAPYAACELGAALADHPVPVNDRGEIAVAQFLRMAVNAWAAAKAKKATDRALDRMKCLHLLECGASVALHDAVDNAWGRGPRWQRLSGCEAPSGRALMNDALTDSAFGGACRKTRPSFRSLRCIGTSRILRVARRFGCKTPALPVVAVFRPISVRYISGITRFSAGIHQSIQCITFFEKNVSS